MHTAHSSSRLLGGGGVCCLSAYWDTPRCVPGARLGVGLDNPLGVGLETPGVGLETLGVGLETPQARSLNISPWVWAWRPPQARPLNFPRVWAWRPPRPDPSTSPWVWAWKPPRPDPSTFPLGVSLETCNACWDTTCNACWDTNPPPREQNDRHV